MILLYIDPGTGSMLFSIVIGAAATLFFLGKAAILKLKVLFSKGKGITVTDSAYNPYVIYAEEKRYWNLFKPVADEFEKRQIPLVYYTSTKDDPVFSQNYAYVKSEYIGEGNKAFARLNFLSAGVVLMTTPGLDVYQLKRSKNVAHYSFLTHSTTDLTTYRLFGLDYFDSLLLTGDYQEQDVRILEKQRGLKPKEIITVGCTYLDLMQNRIKEIPDEENHQFTVLVAPSWGPGALLSLYGEKILDPLVATGWRIILRPHPQSKISESAMLETLQKKYANTENIVWDFERDNVFSLKKADIMISDFSGVIYDYTFLCDKPVIYANADLDLRLYDAFDVGKKIWQFATLEKIGVKLEEKDFANIKQVIQKASDSPELAEARCIAKNEGWMHIGEAGKCTADFMIAKKEQLCERC